MPDALGLLEIRSWSAGLAALDAAEKAGKISLIQAELNDFYGVVIKFSGSVASVRAAVSAGKAIAEQMRVQVVGDVIPAPDARAEPWAVVAPREYNPLIEQDIVHFPRQMKTQEKRVSEQLPFAIGMIETQGFTAVIEAIDTAVKVGTTLIAVLRDYPATRMLPPACYH